MGRSSSRTLIERLEQLERALSQTRAEVAEAQERASRAEARASGLEIKTEHMASAMVSPRPISRRALLTKVAAAGAAGVGGVLLLNRPKDAQAAFTWTGGAANVADAVTTVTAQAAYPSTAVLVLDANQAANPTHSSDGLQSIGSHQFSGIAAYGGNHGGTAYYGFGGPGVAGSGGNSAGYGAYIGSGQNQPAQFSYGAVVFGNGASDGTAGGSGMYCQAGGNGYSWFIGGLGTTATPHINGGTAIYAYGGPGATALVAIGDGLTQNATNPAHGVRGVGNAFGVGGYFQGGRAQVQLIPGAGTGAPTSGQHFAGDIYMDAAKVLWICLTTGTPGTFAPLQPGGINNAFFTAVSTQQYTLINSTGTSWVDMDATNLKLMVTPAYNCQAWISGSADLWTANAGFNQDIGIAIAGGVYPTAAGQPEGWKESGGFAGTFSPNAAHVETVVPLVAGTAYTIKLVWKTNKPGTSTIAAGAGPINGNFSPTRLSAWLLPTNPGGTIPRLPAKPYVVDDLPNLQMPKDPYGKNH
jgi:hypothetical protein